MFALCTIAITNSPSSCPTCSSSEKYNPSPSWFCSPSHGLVVVLGMPIMVVVVSCFPSWDMMFKETIQQVQSSSNKFLVIIITIFF